MNKQGRSCEVNNKVQQITGFGGDSRNAKIIFKESGQKDLRLTTWSASDRRWCPNKYFTRIFTITQYSKGIKS